MAGFQVSIYGRFWVSTEVPTGMRVEKAGDSVVVRIDVPPISIGTHFSAAEAEVETALGAAVRLLNWHREKSL